MPFASGHKKVGGRKAGTRNKLTEDAREFARRFLGDAPWMFLAPTVTIALCVLSINFVGDGLRDALDPNMG